jgi:hypothetical protein
MLFALMSHLIATKDYILGEWLEGHPTAVWRFPKPILVDKISCIFPINFLIFKASKSYY